MTNEEWFAEFAKRESAHANIAGQVPTSPTEAIDESLIFAGYGAYQQQLDEETTIEHTVWLGSEEILDKLRADLIDIEQASIEVRADLSLLRQ